MKNLEKLHKFVIVEFIETKEVGTVCKDWIREDQNGHFTCFWPAVRTAFDVRKAVVSQKSPLPSWEPYRIRILSSCDNYIDAIKRERKAQDTSDLTSCAESETGKGHRKIKPSFRVRKLASESDESETEDDLPDFEYSQEPEAATPLKKSKSLLCSPQSSSCSQSKRSTPSSYLFTPPAKKSKQFSPVSAKKLDTTNAERTSSEPEPTFSSQDGACGNCSLMKDEIEKIHRTLRSLETSLERKWEFMKMEIRELKECVTSISKTKLPERKVLSSAENSERAEFERRFPVTTLEEFLELENSLDDENKLTLMMDFLQRIGGATVEDSVRRALIRLVTNEVGVNLSWEGRKGKRALHSLNIVKALERVVAASHGDNFTSKAFETKVKEWFRQAGTRIYNSSKKDQSVQFPNKQ